MANEFKVKHGLVVNGPIELKNATNQSKSGSLSINNSSNLEVSSGIYSLGDITAVGSINSYNGIYVTSDGGSNQLLSISNQSGPSYYDIGSHDFYPTHINIGNTKIDSYIQLNPDVYYSGNNYFSKSLESDTFNPGFSGYGWQITKSGTRHIATFDDLWVRGSMNVKQFIIDKIRATNGSLWISDAGRALSASYNPGNQQLILQFDTNSTVPFVKDDIIRSKQYMVTGESQQLINWDITSPVENISTAGQYTYVAVSTNESFCTLFGSGTWLEFAQRLSISGSDWIRFGNNADSDRQGNIYLTANDNDAPYIDIINGVTDSSDVTNINTLVKTRLGNLAGLNASQFGQLSGYGLYSDNAYLKGTISAAAGEIGGWSIHPDRIQNGQTSLSAASKSLVVSSQSKTVLQVGKFDLGSVADYTLIANNFNLVQLTGNDLKYWNTQHTSQASLYTQQSPSISQYSRILFGANEYAKWENTLTGSLNTGDTMSITTKIASFQFGISAQSTGSNVVWYVLNGSTVLYSVTQSYAQLNDNGLVYEMVYSHSSALVSHPTFGYKLQSTQVITEPATLIVTDHIVKLTTTPKMLISDKGLHLQYSDPRRYLRLSQNQASMRGVNIQADTVNIGPAGNIVSTTNSFSITLGSTASGKTYLTTTLNDGIYLTGSNFKIENGTLVGGSGGGVAFVHPTYTGISLTGANVISKIDVDSNGTTTTASRSLTTADIGAQPTLIKGNLTANAPLSVNITSQVIGGAVAISHATTAGSIHLPAAGTAGQVLIHSGTAGSGSWSSNIQTTGTASFASVTASTVKIGNAVMVNTTTEVNSNESTLVCSINMTDIVGAFFDYTLMNSTSVRSGTIIASHIGSNNNNTSFSEIANPGIGDFIGVEFEIKGQSDSISLWILNGDDITVRVLGRGL